MAGRDQSRRGFAGDVASGLRGFFLADPEELSLLALVDQFASERRARRWKTYRIDGGNDRLSAASGGAAGRSGEAQHRSRRRLASRHARSASASRTAATSSQMTRNYVVFALPATLLRRTPITPALPAQQHEAIARLKYGRGTKTLLQFSSRFWRVPGRPRAFGSSLPFGAVWEGERGAARDAPASCRSWPAEPPATRTQLTDRRRTAWLAGRDRSTGLGAKNAEADEIAPDRVGGRSMGRGGYAFFDPLVRSGTTALARRGPFGRLFFAGEHTSLRWQGYMNGAIESGRRVAAEVDATHRTAALRPES